MTAAVGLIRLLVLCTLVGSASAEDAKAARDANSIVWGDAVNGLKLGISPPVGTNGVTEPIFDGKSLRVDVFCRNVSASPVRILASVHDCLQGKGGDNALLASGVVLTPKNGGKPVTVTYQGWNHLALLDKRRKNGEEPQQTLNRSMGGQDRHPVEQRRC